MSDYKTISAADEFAEAIARRQREAGAATADIMAGNATATAADDAGDDEGAETFAAFARRMDIDVDTATADQLKAAVKLFDVANKGKKRTSAAASNAELQTEVLEIMRDELIAESRENYLRRNRGGDGDNFRQIMNEIQAASNS